MALALSTKAKIAAATLTAATIIGGAFSVSAQQMALGGPEMTACDKLSLTAPARAVQCRVDALKANTAALRQEGAEARRETAANQQRVQAATSEDQCVDKIKSEIAAGKITQEAVRTALAGRRTRDVGPCNLLGMLTRS